MLKKEDIAHIAHLARIELTDEEVEAFRSEIEPILSYVGKVNEAVGKVEVSHSHINATRPDDITKQAGDHTEALLKTAPLVKDGLVEVKKVLS